MRMNKKDITDKFQSFEEREDVKEIMRLFTIVLAQKYETHGVSLSHEKYHNQFLEEFEVPVLDRDDLERENNELKPKVASLEQELAALKQ